jgi:hypothetical protein
VPDRCERTEAVDADPIEQVLHAMGDELQHDRRPGSDDPDDHREQDMRGFARAEPPPDAY